MNREISQATEENAPTPTMSIPIMVSEPLRRMLLAACLLLAAIACDHLSHVPFSQLDERANAYFVESSQKAVISYAMVRSANAVVSVIQESTLELGLTGVGVSLAIGQVLDPLNDMLERASSILVAALISIGVQRAALEINGELALQGAALIFLLAILPLLIGRIGREPLRLLIQTALVLALLRLAMPLSALVYDQAYQRMFEPQIAKAEETLKIIPTPQGFALNYKTEAAKAPQGFFESLIPETVRQQADDAEEKIKWLKQSFEITVKHASSIINALLLLASTYVTMFLLQVIILPIIVLWLIVILSGKLATWVASLMYQPSLNNS